MEWLFGAKVMMGLVPFERLMVTVYFYQNFSHLQILRSAHTVYLCVLRGSQKKQRLFPYTALTDWFV